MQRLSVYYFNQEQSYIKESLIIGLPFQKIFNSYHSMENHIPFAKEDIVKYYIDFMSRILKSIQMSKQLNK